MLHLLLVNHCALVIDGIKSILDSKVSSPVANSNRELATLLLEKLSEEGLITCLKEFGIELISQLTCFTALQQEAIKWADYHTYRCTPFFCEMWITFVSRITGRNPHPTFYQHVTHHILKLLIKQRYTLPSSRELVSEATATSSGNVSSTSNNDLTIEEQNALRYVCGYIVRTVRYILEKSKYDSKEEMIMCLVGMYGDEIDEERGTEAWCNMIDRGGLWHVSDETYELFLEIETVVRRYYRPELASCFAEQKVVEQAILENDRVLFYWSLFTLSIDNSAANKLLKLFIKKYITTRGFYFATSFVELYKKSNNKLLQKGKGLRKELYKSVV